MDYITGANDTFQSIAADVSGNADFAETIAASNGMYSDVLKVPLNVVLEQGLLLHIPDSIVKENMRIEVIGGASRKWTDWIDTKQIVTLVIAGAIMAMLTRERSRKR